MGTGIPSFPHSICEFLCVMFLETKVKRELKISMYNYIKFNNKNHSCAGRVDLSSKDASTSLY